MDYRVVQQENAPALAPVEMHFTLDQTSNLNLTETFWEL